MVRVARLLTAALLTWPSISVTAEPPPSLPPPEGAIVLTVTGDIAVMNSGNNALFDLALLEALGTETIRTTTLWTDGVHAYTGVPLDRLLDRLGVTGGILQGSGLNDYAVQSPLSDAIEGGPIVAFAVDGKPMSV